MTKTNMQRQDTRYAALLLAPAILMLLVPKVSAAEYTASDATKFVFTDSGVAVAEGNYTGYKIDGTELTINGTGTYLVSGSCSDGSIKVKKGTAGVTPVLNGLTLTSSTTAPIVCNKSTEVNIVVASGTTNTLTDSSNNNDAINAEQTLNIESGTLAISAGDDAIHSDYTLNIGASGTTGPTIKITSCYEGLEAATLNILSGNISITASRMTA